MPAAMIDAVAARSPNSIDTAHDSPDHSPIASICMCTYSACHPSHSRHTRRPIALPASANASSAHENASASAMRTPRTSRHQHATASTPHIARRSHNSRNWRITFHNQHPQTSSFSVPTHNTPSCTPNFTIRSTKRSATNSVARKPRSTRTRTKPTHPHPCA